MRSRPDEAGKTFELIFGEVQAAVNEGRDAAYGLPVSTLEANDPARTITTFGEQLAADQAGPNGSEFRVYVEGKSRGTRFTRLPASVCATRSGMRGHSGSDYTSSIKSSFNYTLWTTAKALTRFCARVGAPDAKALQGIYERANSGVN